MQHIDTLFKKNKFNDKSWLVIGKGPSFSNINTIKLGYYYSFGLNHVIKEVDSLDVTHLIDYNVFESCQDEIYSKAKYLVMPINPHFDNKATEKTLKDLIEENEILKKLSNEKRLFWYNHLKRRKFLNSKNIKRIFYKNIAVKYFSAEAPFSILANNKIKNIESIGVDGGSSYSEKFDNNSKLPNDESTLLSNGRDSFDVQLEEIMNSVEKYNLNYQRIPSYEEPINVYVGSQEEQMLSVKILEYSIKKHTSAKVNVVPMFESGIKYGEPKDPKNRQRTPFSFQRFLIPQLNNFKGKAIYVDSDMQLRTDIRKLYNLPMGDHDLYTVKTAPDQQRVLQFSVMLMDCERLKWDINNIIQQLDSGELTYQTLMRDMKVAKNIKDNIPYFWNCLEWFKKDLSALIHYTDMDTQPWVSLKNKIGHVWIEDLFNALDERFIDIDYIKDHIQKEWIRPSLLYQIENRILDTTKAGIFHKIKMRKLDKDFVAPYKKMLQKQKKVKTKTA